jgi:putative SOS response-associated peptidase YedK
VLIVRTCPHGREAVFVVWGLIPPWASDPHLGRRYINARAETAGVRPAFRDALRHSRCLVPADGYYLWKKGPGGRQPYEVHLRSQQPFAFAGLWRRWEGPDGETIDSCAILTTEANEVVRPINARMPVILERADYDRWLDPAVKELVRIRPLLKPYPAEKMVAWPASRNVANPAKARPEEQPMLF